MTVTESRDLEEDIAPPALETVARLLTISNLSVSVPRYDQQALPILKRVDLAVAPGEIIGLVGESGSGKTMLARAIMRLIPPPGRIEGGRVIFDGRDLGTLGDESLRQIRGRDIAMVISNPRGELDPLRTVGRQIGDVLRHHLEIGAKEARERTLQLLKDVRIPDPERRYKAYPHELSGGMAQRVVIAIALSCSPKFIISDDATSGLDVTVQAQVLELLERLVADRSTSMLFITRDIGIAAHFCDRVAVIYAGEIVEFARRDQFFENPSHPYTVQLLAAFSHNTRLRQYWFKEGEAREQVGPSPCGCAFAPRCVRAQARCRQEHPDLRDLRGGHQVRCHFPVER